MHRNVESSAADGRSFGFDENPALRSASNILTASGNDLRTDAVAGKNCDFHRLT